MEENIFSKKESHFWNQRQKLHYQRNFHQNRTSCVDGRRSNVYFLSVNFFLAPTVVTTSTPETEEYILGISPSVA